MKRITGHKWISFLLILLSSFLCFSQNKSGIDSIDREIARIGFKIKQLNDSIRLLENKKFSLYSHEIKRQDSIPLYLKVRKQIDMKEGTNPLDKIVGKLDTGELALIRDYDFVSGYYGVCIGEMCGYINEIWVIKSAELDLFKDRKRRERYYLEGLKEMEDAAKFEKWKKTFVAKHGQKVLDKVLRHQYWIGMTEELAILSLGNPEQINRTVTRYSVNEQWVYPYGKYLYFENGILESYQD
jgi:hypothetical protein